MNQQPISIQAGIPGSIGGAHIARRIAVRLALASVAGIALNHAALAADPTQYVDVNSSATGNQNNDGALGANSIAIGPNATTSSTADSAIALGNGAQTSAENAISIGNSSVGSSDSFAIGSNNSAGSGNYIFLSGAQNMVASSNSEALVEGSTNTVSGMGNGKIQMLGTQNTLQGNNSSAVQMLGVSNLALGGTSNSALIGSNNSLGTNNKSNSVIGSNNTLGTNNSFVSVLGASNTTTGNGSYNFIGGANNNVGANTMNNILIARNATVSDRLTDTIGLGNAVVVGQNGAVALGSGAKAATSAGDVALGAGSATSAPHTGSFVIAGSTSSAMGTGGTNVLSIGTLGAERQIQNVGAGVLSDSSTDAVNGSQLYATNRQVIQNTSDIATNTTNIVNNTTNISALQRDALQWNASLGAYDASHGSGAAQKISNVLAGTAATDAVNVSQLQQVTTVANAGWNVTTASTGTGTVTGTSLANVAPGSTQTMTAGNNIAITQSGTGLTIATNPDLSLTSVTTGNTAINTHGVTITGGASGTVRLGDAGLDNGGNALTNVAAGVNATDAVNVSQLRQVAGVAANAVQYDDAGHGSVTLGGLSASAPVGLHNVAAGALGAASTDAVNGSQLYATNQQVVQNTADIAGNSSAINTLNTQVTQNSTDITRLSQGIANGTVGLVQQTGGAPGNGQITIGAATGGTSINVAGTDGDRTLSGVAAGVAGDDAVNVAQLQSAIANATFNGVQYDDAARTSVTFNAGGQAVGLHNVAAGDVSAGSTDAINGAQLYATNQQVANNTTQISEIEAGKAGPFRANNSSGLAAPSATGADAVAGGFGAVASGNQSTAIGARASATGSNSVALGYASNDDGRDNVVSVGSGGAERQITNVAAGTKPTDAVNLGQLNQGLAGTLTQANNYTDSRIAALTYDLKKARSDADAGTASALAVAGLPQAFTPGAGMIAGGFGVYRDETAFAIGASKIFNDGHTIVKGGATFTSRSGTVGANLGIGYQF